MSVQKIVYSILDTFTLSIILCKSNWVEICHTGASSYRCLLQSLLVEINDLLINVAALWQDLHLNFLRCTTLQTSTPSGKCNNLRLAAEVLYLAVGDHLPVPVHMAERTNSTFLNDFCDRYQWQASLTRISIPILNVFGRNIYIHIYFKKHTIKHTNGNGFRNVFVVTWTLLKVCGEYVHQFSNRPTCITVYRDARSKRLLSSLVFTTRDTTLSEGGLSFLNKGVMVFTGYNFALMQKTLLSLLSERVVCEIDALLCHVWHRLL